MEAMDRMNSDEANALRETMRERYAVHYTDLTPQPEGTEPESSEPEDNPPDATPGRPSDPDSASTDASSEW